MEFHERGVNETRNIETQNKRNFEAEDKSRDLNKFREGHKYFII